MSFCGAVFYGSAKGFVNARCGARLHAGQHMTVEVECDADGGMSEALAGDLGVNPAREQMRRVSVTKVMKTELWQRGACKGCAPTHA